MHISGRSFAFLVSFFVSLSLHAAELYRQGEAAFKRGDLQAAKNAFQQLYKQNTQNQEAKFSLATVYFEMAEYSAASALFAEITVPEMAPYAWYYLGRIDEAQGEAEGAKVWYERAANQDGVLQAQAWADTALLSLEHVGALSAPLGNKERADSGRSPSFLFAGLETKYTDGLVDPVDTTGVDDGDNSYALLLAGSAPLIGSLSSYELRVGGTYFGEHYADFSEYDIDSASLYMELGARRGANLVKAKAEYQYLWLDGSRYLQQLSGTLSDKISLTRKTSLHLHGRFVAVASPEEEFERYDGDVWEVQARLQGRHGLRWLLDYTYRSEEREDLERSFELGGTAALRTFTSYSRDSHQLRARVSWNYSTNWSQMLELSYRAAEYDDPDIFLVQGSASTDSLLRENDRLRFRAEVTRKLTAKLDVALLYEMFDEDSNNDIYDIDSKSVSLGLNYLFW